jgi:dihydrofolate reductase
MSQRLRFRISISLDGFTAGPDQSPANPLGTGGEALHDWVVPLAAWRSAHGLEGGDVNASTAVLDELAVNIGATILGRNMFGGHPGPWRTDDPWEGWWGRNPPFRHPVFVLTHHARPRLELEGGTSFTFVTDGIESAVRQARAAAPGKDIALAGGADVAKQFLNAGLVDEMVLSMVPILLGAGERLFDGVIGLGELELVRTIPAPGVAHLKFERRSRADR